MISPLALYHRSHTSDPTDSVAEKQLSSHGSDQEPTARNLRDVSQGALEQLSTSLRREMSGRNSMWSDLVAMAKCSFTWPFDQYEFKKALFKKSPEIKATMDKPESGLCFGLSLSWCQQRLQGKTDKTFFTELPQWKDNSLFLRSLALQSIEQLRHPGGLDKDVERCAALAGLECVSIDSKQTVHRIACRLEKPFAERLDALLGDDAQPRCLLLMTDRHALALFKDQDRQLHFFDPNCGVISSTHDNKLNMYLLIHSMLEAGDDLWNDKHRRTPRFLMAAELQLPAARQEGIRPLHTLSLSQASTSRS